MTKLEAVLTLLEDATVNKRISTTSAGRVVRSLNTLGIVDGADIIHVLGYMDYCDTEGKPWNPSIKRVWGGGTEV